MDLIISMSASDETKCIKCGGELDTGGECTECGYDNNPGFNPDEAVKDNDVLKETEKPTAPIDQQDRTNLAELNLRPPEVSMHPSVSTQQEYDDEL